LEAQNPKKVEEIEQLFTNDYISGLVTLLNLHNDKLIELRSVPENIKDLFEFNQKRKSEIEELNEKLEQEKEERIKILGNSTGTEESLSNVLKNYNGWQEDKKQVTKRRDTYKDKVAAFTVEIEELEKKKDAIDLESANSFLVKSRDLIRDIELIFEETKEARFDEFLTLLQDKSNEYFEK
jgi:DNA sulfur modification protein DndD